MRHWNVALGFYQNLSTAHSVIGELKKQGYKHIAYIHRHKNGHVDVNNFYPNPYLLVILGILFSFLFYLAFFAHLGVVFSLLLIAGGAGALLSILILRLSIGVRKDILERLKKRVLTDEVLVIVQVKSPLISKVLAILRQVKTGHPFSFLLRSEILNEQKIIELPKEPLTLEQLSNLALTTANAMEPTYHELRFQQPLLKSLNRSEQLLSFLRYDVAEAEIIEQTLTLSAEWLLDNSYVIQGSIEEIQRNLSKKFYRQLPKISKGRLKGLPRIYAIAIEIVNGTAGKLNRENISQFCTSYQTIHPLTIGELWALPLMLRLRLIEWLQFLSVHLDKRMREGELAGFWGNRLLYASRRESDCLPNFFDQLSKEVPHPSPHFAEELLDHLFDEESVLGLTKKWLESRFKIPLQDVIHQEQMNEAAEQVSFSSAITSLITLTQLAWQDIFEEINPIDAVLNKDPSGTYSQMDFKTRNHYREAIEEISRHSKFSEVEVAQQVLELAGKSSVLLQRHVGYYLIDEGRKILEKMTHYHPPFFKTIQRGIISYPSSFYFSSIAFLSVALEALLFNFLVLSGFSLLQTFCFTLLGLIPLSEIAIQCVNFCISYLLPPVVLPKMLYEKEIPLTCKTLVVIPTLLQNEESIQEDIRQLEIFYLANSDPSLSFSLFSDFCDAPEKHQKTDEMFLKMALDGIKDLENKYGPDKFFLFHRQRIWSPSEKAWIGWERKRGKLENLNCFLMGETLSENILYLGNADTLKGTQYVITLDADTQLPKDRAKELIEVLSHPLNAPYLAANEKELVRGYTIIQPLVSTDFPHTNTTWFTRIFSERAAIDPYTLASSNVYQDLTKEGSYHGKGIYDVKTFHTILSHLFPEEHLLSHDLLEGAYVRVGFASNVRLFDFFPNDYFTWALRQHRWIRGDWQILDWLFSDTPCASKQTQINLLSGINRWKIFDNLRRSILPINLVFLLVSGWIFTSIPGFWTGLTFFILFIPSLTSLFSNFLNIVWNDFFFGIVKTFITASLLPYEAYISMDACIRVTFRRLISHRHLLQWTTSRKRGGKQDRVPLRFFLPLSIISLAALGLLGELIYFHPHAVEAAFLLCLLWFCAPLIVYEINQPIKIRADQCLTDKEQTFLRHTARKTWRYFDDFVGPQSHWLPPDNYQIGLKTEIAHRTSPTNIGMWFLVLLSSNDFKYITSDTLIDNILASIQNIKKLERFEGHLLNWYDILTLNPLYPRYISTVDSGNFLACLWTLEQGMLEVTKTPLFQKTILKGISDTLEILIQEAPINSLLYSIKDAFSRDVQNLSILINLIREALNTLSKIERNEENSEKNYWLKQTEKQINEWVLLFERYFSWVDVLTSLPEERLKEIHGQALQWKQEALLFNPSLAELAEGISSHAIHSLIENAQKASSSEIKKWGKQLEEALGRAFWFGGEKLALIREIISDIHFLSEGMNLNYLYNQDRKVFAIGYQIDERRLDNSFYDLLASEARIASLVAIAKGDVPIDHWWALGRPYGIVEGRKVLLSWGGTMFEYLMPLIFNYYYPDSLLGQACRNVVICQMIYGDKRGMPWGISESAHSAIDVYKTYQYHSFGVPGLGLKRGLEKDLVISPYSTALALSVNAQAAVKNLKRLTKGVRNNLWGPYGFYESIDFTRQYGPHGERGVIVYAYMAHHQGMILTAINNVLNQNVLPKLFHSDPKIRGVESLLYERVPQSPPISAKGSRAEIPRLKPFSQIPIMGVSDTPESVTPKVNLLSNGDYSIMVTNAGGGYSRWKDLDITRWRSDTTCDSWGKFFYIKDRQTTNCWSVGYHPIQSRGLEYSTSFKSDKAEFRRKDNQIETVTEIVVSSEDNAEIQLITLINLSSKTRLLEITSYMELALAPHAADRAHPCFNKLFIETEALPEKSGLLAFRRLRAPDDQPIWAAHVLAVNQETNEEFQFETDRSKFIGRGRTLQRPVALDKDLSNTAGTVLDPIFSLRRRIILEPGQRIQFSFVTCIADSREKVLSLVEKYKEISASHRAFELAWTYAQLELRHLRIHQEEVQLFQKLASRILYPHSQLRTAPERILSNHLGQSKLWAHGISGDLPIIVVTVGDTYDADVVKQTLIAHSFLRSRGLKIDLVILNEEAESYENPLAEQLLRMIKAYAYRGEMDTPGGVFLRDLEKIPEEDVTLLLSVASVVLVAARGSLRQQLVSPVSSIKYPPYLRINKKMLEHPSKPLTFLELPYFNGLGGFTNDGSEYVIYLGPHTQTPHPWINVIANPLFGTMISESGSGCTWYGNSQTNRLTPWSNDPIIDPIADVIYIRDEDLGKTWCPTPSPIRELDAYRISHGQGYSRFEHNSHGIEQELLIFVPNDDQGGLPLRIQRLRLTNHSSETRHLSVTNYSEWILGTTKEETQMHIITEWDNEAQILFASNRYHPDYGNYVAFSSSVSSIYSFTGDRTEFIGRNNSTSNPSAMKRKNLSGKVGAALDPCAALQVMVEIEPGSTVEVIFVLGYAQDSSTARQLMQQCCTSEKIDQLLKTTQEWWNHTLESIHVDVPDLAINFALNRWLIYQNLSSRIWGRTAFYQSSGAYGFRDQLQDVLALLYSHPELAREQILRAAAHQFVEGDVQHWWHPPSGGGIRTRISDDLLWLPFATAQYVRVTGDKTILQEQIAFITAPLLTEDQHEIYSIPEVSKDIASLMEHCRRAIQKGLTAGANGLPLMGGGDWNDGMNRVGIKGKGESVWLGWFLIHVLNDFAELLDENSEEEANKLRKQAQSLANVIENNGWDGAWYRRAYFDDGTPLGSKDSPEAMIDSLAQSWAVISGAGEPTRIPTALASAESHLVKYQDKLVLLLTPAFNESSLDPGYIKGYPPGVRENGGQYTHGSLWLALAYARIGDGDKAVSLLRMMHPISHTPTKEEAQKYKDEPYVLAGDVYNLPGQVGRGGWSWYTGSAAWMYRIWIEEVLGFKLRGQTLMIKCTIPKEWPGYKLRYRYKKTFYEITVERGSHSSVTLDGKVLESPTIPLVDDEKTHSVKVTQA